MRDPASRRTIAQRCRMLLKQGGTPEIIQQLEQWALECDSEADETIPTASTSRLLEQARRHRLRAEEYRAIVEQMQHPAARASYQHLAETYEAMAERLEEIVGGSQAEDREAG